MATKVANNATRQQLDELDTLLQRMLALPVNHLDETTHKPAGSPLAEKLRKVHAEATAAVLPPPPGPPKFPPPAVVYGVPPAPAFAADSPGIAQAKPPEPPPPAPEPSRSWAIDLNPRGSSSVLGERSPLAAAEPAPIERPAPAPMLKVQAMTEPLVPMRRASRRAIDLDEVALPLRPFAAVTGRFDDAVAILGPLGRILSGRFGRFVMGCGGLAMLALSGLWVALAWSGWNR